MFQLSLPHWSYHNTRAIWKVTSSELLTKQPMGKRKLFYIKNMSILKLLLNVATARIEAPVISRNKFLYACVKEVCCLWAKPRFDIFHQLLIIVEALWSQPYSIVNESCGNSHESSEIVKCCLSQIFWSTLWTRSTLTTDGQSLHSSLWTWFPILEHSTPLSYSSLTLHSLYFGYKPCTIHDGFLQRSWFQHEESW
jgi:hypothetical protein